MKNGKLNGKVAVVTGASKGIGAGIAKEFAAEGASVVVNYASAKSDADKVVDQITKRGGKAVAVQANVAKKSEVERLFGETKKALGKIDILVNNAGVYEFVPLEDVTEQQFHRMFDVNVLGMLLATQEALNHFNPNGGSIIELFYVLEGEFDVYVGKEAFKVETGECVFLPRFTPHAFVIRSPWLRVLALFSPAGLEEFLKATSVPAPDDAVAPSEPPVVAVQNVFELAARQSRRNRSESGGGVCGVGMGPILR